MYDTTWPLLFQAGDVVVCDMQMAEGVIESKTQLDARGLVSSLEALADIERRRSQGGDARDRHRAAEVFRAVFAASGPTVETLSTTFAQWVEEQLAKGLWANPEYGSRRAAPHAIYVRGRYLLVRYEDDARTAAERETLAGVAYRVLQIADDTDAEGEALLAFVGKMWEIFTPPGASKADRCPPWLWSTNFPRLIRGGVIRWPQGA